MACQVFFFFEGACQINIKYSCT